MGFFDALTQMDSPQTPKRVGYVARNKERRILFADKTASPKDAKHFLTADHKLQTREKELYNYYSRICRVSSPSQGHFCTRWQMYVEIPQALINEKKNFPGSLASFLFA